MSSLPCPPLPSDTARAAEAVFGREHPYLLIGESLEALWKDLELSAFDSVEPFLAGSLYPYLLATILQYWENLSDQQMAQATRTRAELKYAMHFPLDYPGMDPRCLCSFRQNILSNEGGKNALQAANEHFGRFVFHQKYPEDVDQIITVVCLPSRLEIVLERMGMALEAVATREPGWLISNTQSHWYQRYYQKSAHQWVPQAPREIESLAEAIGNDGLHLLRSIENSNNPALARLPEILKLRREWLRQFEWGQESVKLRKLCSLSCGNGFQFLSGSSDQGEGGQKGEK
ncbi:MAG TPA: transposase [Anaerolineales bacterium]